jgi:hypothetical protein
MSEHRPAGLSMKLSGLVLLLSQGLQVKFKSFERLSFSLKEQSNQIQAKMNYTN